MSLPKRYRATDAEPALEASWEDAGTHRFDQHGAGPIFSIDTPPPTVSGQLHLGHIYSYSHADFFARYRRMSGDRVFYPMGFDDNGLPTERLVTRRRNITASDVSQAEWEAACLAASDEARPAYEALWRRLGLSIDWRFTYRTIEPRAIRIAQWSFLELLAKGAAYRAEAPTLWCPTCHTAIAQADLDDAARETTLHRLRFEAAEATPQTGRAGPEGSEAIEIATTRPELLPACVAIFVHPDDPRYAEAIGREMRVPRFEQTVRVMADPQVDPAFGSGAVMCCTFGDSRDVAWWREQGLPYREAIDAEGRMTDLAGPYQGLPAAEARRRIADDLEAAGQLLGSERLAQTVRTHERCDSPVEYRLGPQWFIRLMDRKDALLEAGEALSWQPPEMAARYREWVKGLAWDWCISRQRAFGVPFPLWHCGACGTIRPAEEAELPIDPRKTHPTGDCECGSSDWLPETDVMDTWATSSMSPQLASRWLEDDARFDELWPMSLRPQAHEIIRTWAFYTIAKSLLHFGRLPWKTIAISGWGLAPEGQGKISKSRGGGPATPMALIGRHSADALRYWSASTGLGRDARFDEEKLRAGGRLATKLWNVARFAERFLAEGANENASGNGAATCKAAMDPDGLALTPADRWLLARLQSTIAEATDLWEAYDYAGALRAAERFFWQVLADNWLEMAKQRLYDPDHAEHEAARFALREALSGCLRLLAPILPFVTEAIWQGLFAEAHAGEPGLESKSGARPAARFDSIHRAAWPQLDERWSDAEAEAMGEGLVAIASAVRRYKSEREMSLGAPLGRLWIAVADEGLMAALDAAAGDLAGITRAERIEVVQALGPLPEGASRIVLGDGIHLAVETGLCPDED